MSTPASLIRLTPQVLAEIAVSQQVCVRPVIQRRTDTETGDVVMIPIRCNSTEEKKCPSCAQRNRWLRITQCHEGWHLDEEPDDQDDSGNGSSGPAGDEHDDDQEEDDEEDEQPRKRRRARSTRRRQDVPNLPRLPVDKRTIGTAFETKDGKTYRPRCSSPSPWAPTARSTPTAPRSTRAPTTTGEPRWTRCTSPSCSTG